MVEVDNGLIILLVAVVIPSITIPFTVIRVSANRNNGQNTPKRTKKGLVNDAELTSLEEFKAVTAESLALKQTQIDELKAKNKSLQNIINANSKKWKEQEEEDDQSQQEQPQQRQINGISQQELEARKSLIKAELGKKINPTFMAFPVFDKVITEIAIDPDFINLAKAFMEGKSGNNQNQSALDQTVTDYL